MKKIILASLLFTGLLGMAFAADPPALLNYQGVLRDASDKPLSGSYDMVFGFFSAATSPPGDLIMFDQHTLATGGRVVVTNGLFNVQLGGGVVTDGPGPGTYTSLTVMFRDYSTVWLEINVGGQTLAPRVQIISAAYALNATNASNAMNATNAINATNATFATSAVSAASASNATNLNGHPASYYLDTSATSQTKTGALSCDATGVAGATGVQGLGPTAGGYFKDSDGIGYAYAGYGDFGVWGSGRYTSPGSGAGGYFKDATHTGYAYIGYGDTGVEGHGAYYGIDGRGSISGGYFADVENSGHANVGSGDDGIDAYGNTVGGYFQDTNSSGYAHVAYGDLGIDAYGNTAGGYFKDADSNGYAWVGYGDFGVWGSGKYTTSGSGAGAYFKDGAASGYAFIGYLDYGVFALGNTAGGYFADADNGGNAYAYVGQYLNPTYYKIKSNGTSSFVQNHPERPDQTIVYASPEGDEVAVYTRGSARLSGGEARVALGETFRFVANPDIGLTAQLTPRGPTPGLYVESLSPTELVVREMDGGGSAVAFDYIVYGLRLGFEQMPNIQQKTDYSSVPPPGGVDRYYAENPNLPRANALARFQAMRADAGLAPTDLSRSQQLVAAINKFDPEVDGKLESYIRMHTKPPEMRPPTPTQVAGAESLAAGAPAAPARPSLPTPAVKPAVASRAADVQVEPAPTGTPFPVSERVEAGDLLVLDPLHPGFLKKAEGPSDPGVVGIASGPAAAGAEGQLEAPVTGAGFTVVKVDTQFGVIRAGDLLVASATPGSAMKAPDVVVAGTVIGKALEPLEAGTGLIKILVMPR